MIFFDYEKTIKKRMALAATFIVFAVLIFNVAGYLLYLYSEDRVQNETTDIETISKLENQISLLEKRIDGNKKLDKLNQDIRSLNEKCAINKDKVLITLNEIFKSITDVYSFFSIDVTTIKEDPKYINLLDVKVTVQAQKKGIKDSRYFAKYQSASRELIYLFLKAYHKEISIYDKRDIQKNGHNEIQFSIIHECMEVLK